MNSLTYGLLKFLAVIASFFFLYSNLMAAGNSDYCSKVFIGEDIEISFYTPTMFRWRKSNLDHEKFPQKYEIPFVIGKYDSWDKVVIDVVELQGETRITTDKIQLRILGNQTDFEVWTTNKEPFKIHPSDAPIYGMFRNGYTLFDNASAFNEKNKNSEFSHWFYNPETKGYTDIYLEQDMIQDKYFIYGPGYRELFKQFNELTGPEPLLPKKGYGFYQTQHLACQGTQLDFLKLAEDLRERDIPCDNLILDFEWGDGCNEHEEITWGSSMDWNANYAEPYSPEVMLQKLDSMNFDVMLIHHNAPDFKNRHHQGWTESLIDEETWRSKYLEKINIGVDGIWMDTRQNDLTDSYIYQFVTEKTGSRINFMGCRKMQMINPWDTQFCQIPVNQVIGGRRYPFDWTGDCSFSWAEFKWQINAITNTHGPMKGVSYIASDGIGDNWKIQARWNQFADFTTISRSHHPRPWSGNIDIPEFVKRIQIEGRDTLELKNVDQSTPQDQTAEKSIRVHRKLRYRLLPYIYSHADINYHSGYPICRPMMLEFPDDFNCNRNQWPYQFMFGDAFLVAPVYGDFQTMEIYLPANENWVDYWTGQKYAGGSIIQYPTHNINKLPLFVKDGSVIPMRQEVNWIDHDIPDYVEWHIYSNTKGSFTLFEDDGKTLEYKKGKFARISLAYTQSNNCSFEIVLSSAEGSFRGQQQKREMTFIINAVKKEPVSVMLNSDALQKNSADNGYGWSYNAKEQKVYVITLLDTFEENKIVMDVEL